MYQKSALKIESDISYHEQMREYYQKKDRKEEPVSLTFEGKEIVSHCTEIINNAQILKNDYLMIEKWHCKRAKELKDK